MTLFEFLQDFQMAYNQKLKTGKWRKEFCLNRFGNCTDDYCDCFDEDMVRLEEQAFDCDDSDNNPHNYHLCRECGEEEVEQEGNKCSHCQGRDG